MSIAKAALIEFKQSQMDFVYSGDLDFLHRVIDRAGAKHVGPGTHHQVLSCIRSSSLWTASGITRGWMGKRANCYKPSDYGEQTIFIAKDGLNDTFAARDGSIMREPI